MKRRITVGIATALMTAAFTAPAVQAAGLSGEASVPVAAAEVNSIPRIDTVSVFPESFVGDYSLTTIPVHGSPATSVDVVDGSLPPGFTVDLGNDGSEVVLSGTATQAGIYFFNLQVSNTAGSTVSKPIVVLVYPKAPWLDPFGL
ncbi:MAG: hypothetical protein RJB01_1539 [Actinomycetota bacterium]